MLAGIRIYCSVEISSKNRTCLLRNGKMGAQRDCDQVKREREKVYEKLIRSFVGSLARLGLGNLLFSRRNHGVRNLQEALLR